ncbi:MAG: hypothetical protein QNK37_34065 [Acidobacteriota bacterium]|nr:hypothetical protein [Acidobacteriota bacterium]
MGRQLSFLLILLLTSAVFGAGGGEGSNLPDDKGPVKTDEVPKRPKPILELGEPFLGTGTLSPGFTLPTGAVWQPQLLVFGSLRTAVQSNDLGGENSRIDEWANRMDLFTNLQLSGSERLVVGLRSLDEDGVFSGYIFNNEGDPDSEGNVDALNGQIGSLFFEGDFGEIFPNLSPADFRGTDIGFALGRQPLSFQEGMLINDTVDGLGLTRNSLLPGGTSNLRMTLFYAWNELNVDDDGQLFGFFTSADLRRSTLDVDAAWVDFDDTADDFGVVGVSAVQRIGAMATSFRVLGSFGEDINRGYVFLAELARTPHGTHNHAYATAFAAVDNFTSASRGPASGGPLGRAGINFAGVGLGNYGAPLSGTASDVAGGAIGYQMFFNNNRRQLLVELGGRIGLENAVTDQFALTARYQIAMGRHLVWVFDTFLADREESEDAMLGGRLELLVKF